MPIRATGKGKQAMDTLIVIGLIVLVVLFVIGIYNRLVGIAPELPPGAPPISTPSCASGTIWCPIWSRR